MTVEEFWTSLDRSSGCWVWMRCLHWKGYGKVWYRGRDWRAHRLAYMLAVGEIPDGMQVLHRCDNRACCNPDHLYVGQHDQNMRDRNERGRTATGERHHAARLTANSVQWIRAHRDYTTAEHAALFGVSVRSVQRVLANQS